MQDNNQYQESDQLAENVIALAQRLKGKKLSDVQLDLLQIGQHLLTNLVFQVDRTVTPEEPVITVFEPGTPVEVKIHAEDREYWQHATVIEAYMVNNRMAYRTTADRANWVDQEMVRERQA